MRASWNTSIDDDTRACGERVLRHALRLCLGFAVAATALAQSALPAQADDIVTAVPSAFAEAGAAPDGSLGIAGIRRAFAPRWSASWMLGPEEQTDLTSAMLRYDHTRAYGTRPLSQSRENWRHFLGVEYEPLKGISLLGGIAKAAGLSKSSGLPTGYERLRLNAGARYAFGDNWGVDGTVTFIPTGANRIPGDAGILPGMGNSNATYLFSLSLIRRF